MYTTTINETKEKSVSKFRGFSFIELLGWAAAVAVIIALLFGLMRSTSNSVNAGGEKQTISALANGVKQIVRGNYGTASLMSDLEDAGLVPPNIIDNSGSTTIYPNAWGGVYDVTGATATYIVSSTNIPDESCIQILLSPMGGLNTAIEVNNTALASTEPTRAQAIAACSNGNQTIEWTFS